MKYEDLVWEPTEGTDYWETRFVLDDKEIKIVKLDEDSFVVYFDGKKIKETNLLTISEQLNKISTDTKKELDYQDNEIIEEYDLDEIQSLENKISTELSLNAISDWEKIVWTKNPKYEYPFIEVESRVSNTRLQIQKLDEDSYKIRGIIPSDIEENVVWNEWDKIRTVSAFAYEMGVDPIKFIEFLNNRDREANTEDVSHTEE